MKRLLRILAGRGEQDKNQRKVTVGICAMDKKATSKPMNQILDRLRAYGEFEIVAFGDDTILNKPIEAWPVCECLLSWHSDGFPLAKAQAYARLRKPFVVNDLDAQDILLDRRTVYRTLVEHNIPVPTHIIVSRDGLTAGEDPEGFIEDEDYVELDGVRINKPFVEKPMNGDDHNIYIYYPHSMGGGVKKLFRKVDNKSSQYDPHHKGNVRREGSFIYEEFLPTGGTDVKVYTVGPRYAHAEARKSPVVDGKVLRSSDGKEMRFPVLLSPQEKEVARQVVTAFKQNVCGFDLLRSEKGRSYVCDVNGWSFVKNSKRYYDDAAGVLRSILLGAVAPERLAAAPNPSLSAVSASLARGLEQDDAALLNQGEDDDDDVDLTNVDENEVRRTEARSQNEELRCVLAIIRHGDRTPKQKLKLKVTAEPLLSLFHKYKDPKGKQAKLKSPNQLQELLDITRQLLQSLDKQEVPAAPAADAAAAGGEPAAVAAAAALSDADRDAQNELREKLRIVRTVLEQAAFNGINRKVQLKPTKWKVPDASAGEQSEAGGDSNNGHCSSSGGGASALRVSPSSACLHASAGSTASHGSNGAQLEEALMVVKWGGVLTHAGRQQAEELGRVFRLVMYPRYGSAGGGLLRLHSTYRHDLKIYSSDEGRVQVSAAAFAKGLLDLEGNSLTPILVSLVKKDASMLDAFGKGASEDIRDAKNAVYEAMTWDPDKAASAFTPLQTTPPQTPPVLSPRYVSRSSSFAGDARTASLGGAVGNAVPHVSSCGATAADAAAPAARSRVSGTLPGLPPLAPAAAAHQQLPPSASLAAAQAALAAAAALPSAGATPDGLSPTSSVPTAHGVPPALSLQEKASQDFGPLSGGSTAALHAQPSGLRRTASNNPVAAGRPVPGMPDQPLSLLKRMVELMRGLVGQLRELCLQERMVDPAASAAQRFSTLGVEPSEVPQETDRPCGGERMLLMFDRWQKLLKSFYNEKKDRFDISKVPDIYDSAKYDAIHNSHLGLSLADLYTTAKQLADAVIPNEYGTTPNGKLRIGSKIATELLGKLLVDLAAMREESLATANEADGAERADGPAAAAAAADPPPPAAVVAPPEQPLQDCPAEDCAGGCPAEGELPAGKAKKGKKGEGEGGDGGESGGEEGAGDEDEEEEDEEDGAEQEPETIHRLLPAYAPEINSPNRHVRTRIYFTSESHIHSLVNVLRYGHLHPAHASMQQAHTNEDGFCESPLLRPEACAQLDATTELDYLTHIVFRMYENKAVPVTSDERFRIEVLFSPGANYSPIEAIPRKGAKNDHVLPVVPRTVMQQGDNGVTLTELEDLLLPMAHTKKFAPPNYAAQLLARNNPALGLGAFAPSGGAGGSAVSLGGVASGRYSSRFGSHAALSTLAGQASGNHGPSLAGKAAEGHDN